MARRKKRTSSTTVMDELVPGFTARSDQNRASNLRGKTYERAIARDLKKTFPHAARSFGQAREGYRTPDVVGTPFWIECAKGSTNAIHDKLRQGLDAAGRSDDHVYGGAPVIVFSRHDRAGFEMATMRKDQFLDLLARAYKLFKL